MAKEDREVLRNLQNYNEDLSKIIPGDLSSSNGIIEHCVFNNIPSFHVTENNAVDIAHDLFEGGVCNYALSRVLNYFIKEIQAFTLTTFNIRISDFNFVGVSNKPRKISSTQLDKGNFKLTMSETQTFMEFLPALIGDLIPANDCVWHYFLILHQITEIVLKLEVTKEEIESLQVLIEEHHDLYCTLFDDHLTPKFHNMIHYPRIIKLLGPLRKMWTIRCESKHLETKQYFSVNTSRKNVDFSASIKAQLTLSYLFLCNENYVQDSFIIGPTEYMNLKDIDFFQEFQAYIPSDLDNVFVSKWIKYLNNEYSSNRVLYQHSDSCLNDEANVSNMNVDQQILTMIKFYRIFLTYTTKNSENFALCTEMDVLSFKDIYFVLKDKSECDRSWKLFKLITSPTFRTTQCIISPIGELLVRV